MKRIRLLFALCLLVIFVSTSCKASKKCGCPTFGLQYKLTNESVTNQSAQLDKSAHHYTISVANQAF